MRILMLAQFYPPIIGGEERHVRNLAHGLSARGHEVAVATFGTAGETGETMDGPVRVHYVRGLMQQASWLFSDSGRRHASPFPDPGLSWQLKRLVASFNPDIVHAHNWIVHSYLPVKPFSRAGLVLTLHDYSMICARKTLMQGETPCSGPAPTKCLRCAADHYGPAIGSVTTVGNRLSGMLERGTVDRVLSVSRAVAEGNRLGTSIPNEVIPNFIPDTFPDAPPDERLSLLPETPYILLVGDLRALKGLNVTLEAYKRLRNAPKLVAIGRKTSDIPNPAPEGVIFAHDWPHTAVMQAWRRSLFGLVPSVWPDPCPTVTLEAMASSKAVIGSATGGIPDMIDDGKTGLLVPPANAEALAHAMQTLIDDPQRAVEMGRLGALKAKSFMASSVIPRIEAVYQNIQAKRTRGMPNAAAHEKVGT